MDLIYMNENKEDVGILTNYTFDLAYGTDENDFELTTSINNTLMKSGYIIYIENTEYGGIIDSIEVDTANEVLIYRGRTWHGILASKIVQPPNGEDYLTLTGDLNDALQRLIDSTALNELFIAKTENAGVSVSNYKVARYVPLYSAIKKLLKSKDCKLKITFVNGLVTLSSEAVIDYSKLQTIDNDMVNFDITAHYNPINHVICLGSGQLQDRTVLHLYSDVDGNFSQTTQSFFGIDEVMSVYEDVNAEDEETLIDGGKQLINESRNQNALEVTFNAINEQYDIGDIIEAQENITGLSVRECITKKIVKIENGLTNITYEVGGV